MTSAAVSFADCVAAGSACRPAATIANANASLIRGLCANVANHLFHGRYHHIGLVELDVVRRVRYELIAAVGRPRGLIVMQYFPFGLHSPALLRRHTHRLERGSRKRFG